MRFRTFIAINVSPFSRDRLRGLQEQLASVGEGVRWVEANNLHLTLIFLGEVNEREVVDVCRVVNDVCSEVAAFSMTLQGLSAFPTPRRPRTLIANITDGADELISLHSALENSLLELGCYRREERAYTPHVTIGRVTRDGADDLPTAIQKFKSWQGGETQVREVQVMASVLGQGGPDYSVLGRAKLRGTG